jgi:poly-gamma-glutamate capsule biosynthesis protein CapA/YwtB (metallophosphatase superfamily)
MYGILFLVFLSACAYGTEPDSLVFAKKHGAIKHPNFERTGSAKTKPPEEKIITISAAGDVTIGSDDSFGYTHSFHHEADKNGFEFFVKNIQPIFKSDDLTTVNLETTLTTASKKAVKTFRFKGEPSYTEILALGSIEAVNLANNHTFDYLTQGYQDTITNLQKFKVGYFGNGDAFLTIIKGIKIGALGYKGWADTEDIRKQIAGDIRSLRNQGANIIIIHFHWGEEGSYQPNNTQISLGRYSIDAGADLVVGHHPHVIQGIEEYKNKFIVYSLGNFMFGGNRNPSDKDTFIFQQHFYLRNGEITDKKEIRIIPASISSVSTRNNYQPTPLQEAEAVRVMNKIKQLSAKVGNFDWVVVNSEHQ